MQKEPVLTSEEVRELFGIKKARHWWERVRPMLIAKGLIEYQLTKDKRSRRYPQSSVMKLHKDFQHKRVLS